MKEFEQIYTENYRGIYIFLFRLCKNHALAEELTQETFYQAFLSYGKFRGDCRLFSWLAAVAKHIYFHYLRKNRLGLDSISFDPIAEIYCANQDSPAAVAEKNATREAVRRLIARIPEKYRDVVMLRLYADLPFSQVASVLHISECSAKVIFFRAKKMLMEEITNEFEL